MRVLIVDDEPAARSRMRRLVNAQPDVEVVGEAANGVEALAQIDAEAPDLVLLDIEMPELDGLEVARALPPDGPAVVFVTAYDAYALDAFEAAAVDYLVKPVARARLTEALDRVRRARPQPNVAALSERLGAATRLAVRSGKRIVVFDAAEVSAVLAQDNYAAIQLADGGDLLSEESLDALEARLDPRRFLRVHRSALINLDHLRELDHVGDRRYVAVLGDAQRTRAPISRQRLKEVQARLDLV